MKSFLIQFHAASGDVISLVDDLRSTLPTVKLYFWRDGVGVLSEDSHSISQMVESTDWLFASDVPLEPNCGGAATVLNRYPGVLEIELPKIRGGVLREVAASARTFSQDGLERIACWGRFARRLRKRFKSGARVFDPASGVGRYYKNAHALPGALHLSKSGVLLCGCAGNMVYDFFTDSTD